MKHTLFFLALALAPVAHADQKTDHDSIASMQGCFEVTFHFHETGTKDPNYPIRSKDFDDHGLEWVTLDRDTDSLLSLQHILITPSGPLKHWRQEWEFQPESLFAYVGNSTWSTQELVPADVAGKWIQRVSQVDDSPRYACVAAWGVNTKGQNYWECKTYAPLPRREFSQRSDYNLLDRGNRHVLTTEGWLHEQNNTKLLLKGDALTEIATEEGLDTYRRVPTERCVVAQTFWVVNKAVWNVIQDMWAHIRSHHPMYSLISKVDEKLLWENLFNLAAVTVEQVRTEGVLNVKALQKKTHDLIHLYMVVPDDSDDH